MKEMVEFWCNPCGMRLSEFIKEMKYQLTIHGDVYIEEDEDYRGNALVQVEYVLSEEQSQKLKELIHNQNMEWVANMLHVPGKETVRSVKAKDELIAFRNYIRQNCERKLK